MSLSPELKPVLEVKNLTKHYEIKRFMKPTVSIKALQSVDFSLMKNQTLSIVGESGCGKSTLAKVLMHIENKTSGNIYFDDKDSSEFDEKTLRKKIQMIFQDPYGSLNPRKKAIDLISEPLLINTDLSSKQRTEMALEMMNKVGLRPEMANRYPHMFSGGQRQRIGIARALVLKPKILICDEPVSALDVSVQAQVLNLLMDIQSEFQLSLIFISHDLSVVRHISDEIIVMYLGQIVEKGSRDQIFSEATHPYTKLLLKSKPKIYHTSHEKLSSEPNTGEIPSAINPPSGCAFHTRCPSAQNRCKTETPLLKQAQNRKVACHFVD